MRLCVCAYVRSVSAGFELASTMEGDKEKVSNGELPLILSCLFSLSVSFFLSLTRLTLITGVLIIIRQIGVVDGSQVDRCAFMCLCMCSFSTMLTRTVAIFIVFEPREGMNACMHACMYVCLVTPFSIILHHSPCIGFMGYIQYTCNLLLNTALCFFWGGSFFKSRVSNFRLPCCLSPPPLSNSSSPHAGLLHCQKLPEQKNDDGIEKKDKQEMSLKIGLPFMDDKVSCEVPDCNQYFWRGENNHLATLGTAMGGGGF